MGTSNPDFREIPIFFYQSLEVVSDFRNQEIGIWEI